MSKFIITALLFLGAISLTNAQTIQQIEYNVSNTDILLYKKFKKVASSALRQTLADMTLRGEAYFQEYIFRKAGRFKDRIEIIQNNAKGEVAFHLEILESTFLHFLNAKELAQEEEEKRLATQFPLLTFAIE